MNLSGIECARARESVSADLDRELQELEARRLKAHLRVCANCSAWAQHVTATTTQLREAAFEAPLATVVELPRRGRTLRARTALAVAPAAALIASVVVSLAGAQHGLSGGQRTTSTSPSRAERHLVRNDPSVDVYRLPTQHRVFQPV